MRLRITQSEYEDRSAPITRIIDAENFTVEASCYMDEVARMTIEVFNPHATVDRTVSYPDVLKLEFINEESSCIL